MSETYRGAHTAPSSSTAEDAHQPLHDSHASETHGGTLSPTAGATYELACELAALAEQDERERALAMSSLATLPPTNTTPLPGGSRQAGMTQSLPKVTAAPASVEQVPVDGEDKRPHRRGRVIAGVLVALALVVAAGATVFFMAGGPALFTKPDTADVQAAIEADATLMQGFAANDYVQPSDYEVSQVEAGQAQAQDDGSVLMDATALLRNEYFESDCTLTIKFARVSDAPRFSEFDDRDLSELDPMDWTGVVIARNASTRAIAPVSQDPEFPGTFSPEFDEAAQTCTATASDSIDLWFGSRSTQRTYTYAFDGTAWKRTVGEPTEQLAIDAAKFEGTYVGQGDAARLTGIKIANFNAGAGTFTIEYAATTGGISPQSITGILDCTFSIAPATDANASYRQTDGYVYAFSGSGTSTGGEGSASIEGVLSLDGTIAVDFSGDYTKPAFLFGEPTNESMSISGMIARAE